MGVQQCSIGSLPELRFAAEDVVVVLGEAVRFVADILQQSQRECVAADAKRLVGTGDEDLFFAFGQ